jgi:cyclopropane fatty-acyl-phospholipid synthase-like methyltransferase
MNQFETPPQLVLDLGCGGGLWIIEAAKKWKV